MKLSSSYREMQRSAIRFHHGQYSGGCGVWLSLLSVPILSLVKYEDTLQLMLVC